MDFRKCALVLSLFVTACASASAQTPAPIPTETPKRIVPTPRYDAPTQARLTPTPKVDSTPQASSTPRVESATLTATPNLNAWMSLPVRPEAGENVRAIYERGIELGNDPNAFSIFGDCQAEPQEFLGVYDIDAALVQSLPPELRETVEHFSGSFERESPTAQDGTTPGALLWDQWHRGEYGCQFGETPVDCELRVHRPSFVIIQIGSHFESRNTEYLRRIIAQLIENGSVPILATKADNRELDHRINRDMALLADEFDLPLWNFWASLSDLPNRGLFTHPDRPLQGDIYLTDEAKVIHRETGLEALNIVWRAATGN
ncbi:MAG: hypothetical protein HS100_10390 [Anaerolineales bacterium]|nr:hypothetical protein [Anaerolineales bacterium]